MVREWYDTPAEVRGKNWGYQSIGPSEAYREGYDRIRWGSDEVAECPEDVDFGIGDHR